jgi:hypothetical protein
MNVESGNSLDHDLHQNLHGLNDGLAARREPRLESILKSGLESPFPGFRAKLPRQTVCGLCGTKILATTDEQTPAESDDGGRPSRCDTTLAAERFFTVPRVASGHDDCVGMNERDAHAFNHKQEISRSSEFL